MKPNIIANAYDSTLDQLKVFFEKRNPVMLKKGDVFIDYGDNSGKLGIVLNGLLYSSYVSDSGIEWVSNFFYPPNHSIITSYENYLKGTKSSEAIRAYEDSELIFINKSEFEILVKKSSKLEHMVRVMAELSYVQTLKRVYSFQSQTAIQRVKKFISEHGELLVKVQRQHLASYLGIHRNIFTRILNKL